MVRGFAGLTGQGVHSRAMVTFALVIGIIASIVVTPQSATATGAIVPTFADPGEQFQATNLTSSTMKTVSFDDPAFFGSSTVNPIYGTVTLSGIGTLSGSGTVYRNDYVWGGAGGSGGFAQSGDLLFSLNDTQRYVGFWWSAGNSQNYVTLLDSSGEALASFTTADLFTSFGGDCWTSASIEPYCGNPNSAADPTNASAKEPFAYIHIRYPGGFSGVSFSGQGFEFDNVSFSETVPSRVNTETAVTTVTARTDCSTVNSGEAESGAFACPKNVTIARNGEFSFSPLAESGISGYSYPGYANVSDAFVFDGVGSASLSGNDVLLESDTVGTFTVYYAVEIGGMTDTSLITVTVVEASGITPTTIPIDPRATKVRLPRMDISGTGEVVMCVTQVTDVSGTTEDTNPSVVVARPTATGGVSNVSNGLNWKFRGAISAVEDQSETLEIRSAADGRRFGTDSDVYLRVQVAPGLSGSTHPCSGGSSQIVHLKVLGATVGNTYIVPVD